MMGAVSEITNGGGEKCFHKYVLFGRHTLTAAFSALSISCKIPTQIFSMSVPPVSPVSQLLPKASGLVKLTSVTHVNHLCHQSVTPAPVVSFAIQKANTRKLHYINQNSQCESPFLHLSHLLVRPICTL